jgi:hypothetical protein
MPACCRTEGAIQTAVFPRAQMLARLDAACTFTAICHGLDRALAWLEAWGLLRGKAR